MKAVASELALAVRRIHLGRSVTRMHKHRDTIIVALILAAALIGACPALSVAGTIYVKWDSPTNGTGSSWGNAYHTVAAGLAAAAPGDEVWTARGTYIERITLKNGVGLYGGFAGTESARGQRDWNANKTVLDANKAGNVVTGQSGAAATTVMDGFTITNGSKGIDCSYFCSPSLSNNTVTANSQYGIYCYYYSSPLISNNTLSENVGFSILCVNHSSPSVTGNTLGSICCDSYSSALIAGNTITADVSCSASSDAVITNNTMSGGAITCGGCSPSITGNTIHSSCTGWGIYCSSCSSSITNNTITGSDVGIMLYLASPVITNNIIAFNGKGLRNYSGSAPVLKNNCIYNPDGTDYDGLAVGAGDISQDPRFVSAAYGFLHIQPTSPCINKGLDSAVSPGTLDVDGQPRIQGAHVDMGADESDGTTWPEYQRTVVRVSPSGVDDVAHDGSSWPLAKRTVQAGIDATPSAGGEVWVAAGTYPGHVMLRSHTYVYGGFAGAESELAQRNWALSKSILDGGGTGNVVSGQPGYHLSSLDGFTVTNGSTGIN
jgi:parallel beta-helix repeat protein